VQKVAESNADYQADSDSQSEIALLDEWLTLNTQESELKKQIKDDESALDAEAYAHYSKLNEDEVKTLVVDDKWLATLDAAIHSEMDRISQQLTIRVRELAERYDRPLPKMAEQVNELESKVYGHLERMGFAWN